MVIKNMFIFTLIVLIDNFYRSWKMGFYGHQKGRVLGVFCFRDNRKVLPHRRKLWSLTSVSCSKNFKWGKEFLNFVKLHNL